VRAFLWVVALLGLLSSAANAGPKEDALAVLEKWTKAFTASDVDGIVKLYAPDALFIGTASKAVVVKPEGIRSYFENALPNNRPRGATLNNYEGGSRYHRFGHSDGREVRRVSTRLSASYERAHPRTAYSNGATVDATGHGEEDKSAITSRASPSSSRPAS